MHSFWTSRGAAAPGVEEMDEGAALRPPLFPGEGAGSDAVDHVEKGDDRQCSIVALLPRSYFLTLTPALLSSIARSLFPSFLDRALLLLDNFGNRINAVRIARAILTIR